MENNYPLAYDCRVKTEIEETHDVITAYDQPVSPTVETDLLPFPDVKPGTVKVEAELSFEDIHDEFEAFCEIDHADTSFSTGQIKADSESLQVEEEKNSPIKEEFCMERFQSHDNEANRLEKTLMAHVSGGFGLCGLEIEKQERIDESLEEEKTIIRRTRKKTKSKRRQKRGHEKRPTDAKPYKCETCGKAFATFSHLQRHELTHSDGKPLECDTCGRRFKHEVSLKRHLSTHTTLFKCRQCNQTFLTLYFLRKHEITHKQSSPSDSILAKSPTEKYILAEQKTKRNTKEKRFKCLTCSKMFASICVLRKHEKIHSGQKPYKCSLCDKRFLFKHAMKNHEWTHTDETPYKCSICNKSFTCNLTLMKHLKCIHMGEKLFKCEICGMSFATSYHLKRHENSPTCGKTHKCLSCIKSFTKESNLINHIKRFHHEIPLNNLLPEKKFKLTKPDPGFKLTKPDPGPFQCSKCLKVFKTSSHLKRHEWVHSGQKPFQCSFCDKSFPYSTRLQEHEARHRGAKLFKCDVCGESFASDYLLKSHLAKTHDSNWHFQCRFCGKRFPHSTLKNDHEKTHRETQKHKKSSKCNVCNTTVSSSSLSS